MGGSGRNCYIRLGFYAVSEFDINPELNVMSQTSLFICHDVQSGQQEFVKEMWQLHLHHQIGSDCGLTSATVVEDCEESHRFHVQIFFLDQLSRTAYENSVAYVQYIWDVLPLLTHKPALSTVRPAEPAFNVEKLVQKLRGRPEPQRSLNSIVTRFASMIAGEKKN
jgi:hypothetical protein